MSLAIKISNIRQAELAVNRLSDRMNASERIVNRKIDEAITKARGAAERAARVIGKRGLRKAQHPLIFPHVLCRFFRKRFAGIGKYACFLD